MPRPTHSSSSSTAHRLGVGEAVVVGVLVSVLVVGFGVWLCGGVASVLSGNGWPPAAPVEALGVLLRLRDHLGDPRQAWPADARADVPGPVSFYAVAVLLLVAIVALAIAAAVLAGRLGRLGSSRAARRDKDDGARWGARRDARALITREPVPGRVVLGRLGRSLVSVEQRMSTLVIGGPRTGKSSYLGIPAILEWPGVVIATSVKNDLIQATLRARQARGRTWIFDPCQVTGVQGARWSPLAIARTWDGALRVAESLTSAAGLSTGGVKGGDFWVAQARELLAPLLFAAAVSERSMKQVTAWALRPDVTTITHAIFGRPLNRTVLERASADQREAHEAILAFAELPDETAASVAATLRGQLQAFREKSVVEATSTSEITARGLLAGPNTLFLAAPVHDQRRLAPLFAALIEHLISGAYQLANENGGELRVPLLVVLDEMANIAPVPHVDQIATTAPSHGIQLMSIFHDLGQVQSVYGDRARTLINAHRARVLLPGLADGDTLDDFSKLLGEQDVELEAVTNRAEGGQSTTRSTGRRRLAGVDELRRLREDEAVVLYGNLPPLRVRQRRWFEDQQLRAIANAEVAELGQVHRTAQLDALPQAEAA